MRPDSSSGFGTMTRIRSIVAVLLVALWVPLTAHCQLESMGALPALLHCADECAPSGSGPDGDDDSCAAVESASYKVDDEQPAVAAPLSPPFFLARLCCLNPVLRVHGFTQAPATADSALPVAWQFFLRAALPIRAPSLAS